MNKFLKEPLVHFLALGALIFIAYGWLAPQQEETGKIIVTRGQQQHMANVFMRTWQRVPTEQEFTALVREHIREEIAFREGIAMGFDEGDSVIRRRMRQKLELLSDEIVGLGEPDNDTLQAFLDRHADQFMLEPVYDLRHIYISRDRRGTAAEEDARQILEELPNSSDSDWEEMGDPLTLPDRFLNVRESELERLLGQQFTSQLPELETGIWSGPVTSGYGFHLVIIDSVIPGRIPDLGEVKERVRSEWFAQQRLSATERLYEQLALKYTIEVEPLDVGSDS